MHAPQRHSQRGTGGARMCHHGDRAAALLNSRRQRFQRRDDAGGHVLEAFGARHAVGGEIGQRHRAKIGKVGQRCAILRTEILLPEARVFLERLFVGQRGQGLAAAQGRARHQMRPLERRAQGRERRALRQGGLDVEVPAKPPAMRGGCVADDDQFVACQGIQYRTCLLSFLLECHALMGKSILITGGARSGKSALAERLTLALGTPAVYIATAQPMDGEMAARIARHQARRGPEWRTVAEPLDLCNALTQSDGSGPRLVDCLTLWLSNLMQEGHDWEERADALSETLVRQSSPVVLSLIHI